VPSRIFFAEEARREIHSKHVEQYPGNQIEVAPKLGLGIELVEMPVARDPQVRPDRGGGDREHD
jgi:hypothetical protein